MEKKQKNSTTYTKIDEDIQLQDALMDPPPQTTQLIDDSEKVCLLNLVHPAFRPRLADIPVTVLELSFEELTKRLRPTVTMYRLRYMFWSEYEFAIQTGSMLRMARVWRGICSESYYDALIKNQLFLAFMINPPTDYITVVKESLQAGMENLRKIVSADVFDEDGRMNPRAADVVIKGIALLDLRVKGAVIQRIDQRLVSLNVNKDIEAMENPDEELDLPNSLDLLEKEIEVVKQKLLAGTIPGVRTTTDLVNYTQKHIDEQHFRNAKTAIILANPRKKAPNE